MGPFYKTNASASTACASRRIGNLAVANFAAKNRAGEKLAAETIVNSNRFNLLDIGDVHQGRKPYSTSK